MDGLTLLDEYATIKGEYYTVSNGFISKAYGELQLKYGDLLTVEFTKHRSKKMLYAMLIPTGIIVLVFNLESFLSIVATALLAILVCVMGILYFLSVRRFVEVTSMRGTYRIAVERDDSEIESVVTQLQRRIFPKA